MLQCNDRLTSDTIINMDDGTNTRLHPHALSKKPNIKVIGKLAPPSIKADKNDTLTEKPNPWRVNGVNEEIQNMPIS